MTRLLWSDRRGLAAIEFVLIAPFLVFMAAGSAELVHYIRTRDMFYTAVVSLADMVASQQGVTATGAIGSVADACTGARMVLVNDPLGAFAAAVVSVTNSSTGVTYDWEVDNGCIIPPPPPPQQAPQPPVGQAPPVGAAAAISAAGPMVPNVNDSVIMVQAQSNYVPYLVGIVPAFTFHATLYSRPRYGQVICTGCSAGS